MAGQTIMIASGKGGAGKSTLCVAIGAQLAKMNRRVLLLDLDFGIRALDLFTHAENVPYHLADVLARRCKPADALISVGENGLLSLCQAAPEQTENAALLPALPELTALFARHFDDILLDCPAGVNPAFTAANAASDRAVLVTTPDPVAVRSAAYCAALLRRSNSPGEPSVRLIINRVFPTVRENCLSDFDRIMDQIGVPLLGVLPNANGIAQAAAAGRLPAFCEPKFSEAVRRVALRLTGTQIPLFIR